MSDSYRPRATAPVLPMLLMVLATMVAGCGPDRSDAASGRPGPVRVDVQIHNGRVSPAGQRINARVGQMIRMEVSSDQDDEIHVHSAPEREFEVDPDPQQVFTFTLNRPGVYEVESHETEELIISLAVRP